MRVLDNMAVLLTLPRCPPPSHPNEPRKPCSAWLGCLNPRVGRHRPVNVIPLLSQAVLEARAYALQSRGSIPLAVVHVDHAPRALIANVVAFAQAFGADVAVGFVSAEGASAFLGEGLEGLNVSAPYRPRQVRGTQIRTDNLFSDLNQWMLKVLLAPELPEGMLNAPRGHP